MTAKSLLAATLVAVFALSTGSSEVDAENVSAAFDGDYFGQRQLIDALSTGDCAGSALHSIRVTEGIFRDEAGDIRGFVTSDGFYTGTYAVDGTRQPFEGLVENDEMIGGVVSPDGKCFWLIRMAKT